VNTEGLRQIFNLWYLVWHKKEIDYELLEEVGITFVEDKAEAMRLDKVRGTEK